MSPALRRFRRWNSLSHTWLGIVFGLVFTLLGLTGALASFRPEWERLASPRTSSQVVCHGDLSLQNLEASLAQVDAAPLDRIYLAANADPRVLVRVRRGESDYRHWVFDACSGRMLGQASLGWLDWTVDLHHNFLAGKAGRRAVGITGALLWFNALAGLVLWLLSHPQWRHFWAWPTRAGFRAANFSLHRSVGLVAMAFLLVEAGTGFFLAFPLGESAGAPKRVKRTAAPLLPLDRYLDAARRLRPGGRVRELKLGSPTSPVSVEYWLAPAQLPRGDQNVQLNRSDAALLQVSSKPLMTTIGWLHYSEWGGAPARYLAALLGLSPAFLFVSGLLIWALPKLAVRRRPVRQKKALPAELVLSE